MLAFSLRIPTVRVPVATPVEVHSNYESSIPTISGILTKNSTIS